MPVPSLDSPSKTPGAKCAGQVCTEDVRGQFLTGLDGVACFMPKSEEKALGFAHDVDKGQRRGAHRSQQGREGELLAGFRLSSKAARASKRARAAGKAQPRGLGAPRTSLCPQNRPHTHRHFCLRFRGGSRDPLASALHSGSQMPQVLPPVLPLAPVSQFPSL